MKSGNVQLMGKSVIAIKDHFVKMFKRQKIHAVGDNYESSGTDTEYDQYFVQSIECTSDKVKDWKIVVEICGNLK